jgi:hypothetical protein
MFVLPIAKGQVEVTLPSSEFHSMVLSPSLACLSSPV